MQRTNLPIEPMDWPKGTIYQRGYELVIDTSVAEVSDIIAFAENVLKTLNSELACRENQMAITKLQEAQLWLLARRLDREHRGVKGTREL